MDLIFNEKVLHAYCDASFYSEYNKGLIAFVLCDQQDNVIYKKNKMIECSTSMEAEFLAIKNVVMWINLYQKSNLLRNRIYINIVSDAKNLVEYINSPKTIKCNCVDKANLTNLIEQMDHLRNNNTVSVKFKNRKNNKLAHNHTKPSCLYAMV